MSRIRTNLITNRMANGAPTVSHGLVIAGVTTVTGSINNLNLTGITTISTLDLNGDLDVDGHLNADNVSIAGVVTATSFSGDGSNLTGITQTTINSNTNNYLITGTGTANTLQGEANLSFNGTNVKIGSGTPAIAVGSGLEIDSGGAATVRLEDSGSTSSFEIQNTGGVIKQNMYNNQPWTVAYNSSEKFRITSSGDILLNKGNNQNTILSNTSDGSDSQSVFVGGGGGPSDTRGAYIWAKGNEYTTTGGFLQLNAGNVGTAPITFSTGGNERLRIDSSGRMGLGTNSPSSYNSKAYNFVLASSGHAGMTIAGGTSSDSSIYFADGTSGAAQYAGWVQYEHDNNNLTFGVNTSERVRFQSDGSCYFGPQIITEADMGWGHDAHQRPYVFSGNQAGVNPADATIVVANPNTDPPSTRLGSFMFGCKSSSAGNSGIKAYIEGWTTSNPSNTYEAGGYIKFVTRQSGGSLSEHFKIDHDGKLYKSGNHFYPLVNYTEVTTFSAASVSSSSYTDLRTILSGYTPKKAGNLIVIHHQSQCWQGGHANSNGDAMWKIQRQEGGGSWTDVTENDRIMGNMDGRNYTGQSGLARHHRTVHLMGSFICNGSSFNLKSLGKVDFTSVGLQWYHHSFNILQVWEYEKG